MKNLYLPIFAIFIALGVTQNTYCQHAYLDQEVHDRMATASPHDLIPVVLLLADAVDAAALKNTMIAEQLPVNRRPQRVLATLKAKADETQPAVVAFIESSALPHSNVQRFWITNSIGLSANGALIEALAARSDIAYISLDAPLIGEADHFKVSHGAAKAEGGIEPGLAVIGAPEMWALGYTGRARMAMTFDTGVWPDHPALTNRFLPNRMPLDRTWFPFDSEFPTDKSSSHGTHVSGTMLGLDTATADTIGVAFGAYFIATDPTVQSGQSPKPLTAVMTGFQWALNPDGDDSTSDDVPDVINNSWGRTPSDVNPPCAPFVISTFEAVEAAGIASIFSAGNNGPEPSTIGVPSNTNMGLVNSFCIGALNGNAAGPEYPIANFSSRGPSLCDAEGSLLTKPEVSAPGVAVRSSVGSNSYDVYSGTSMAAPHVSGAALLLKEAFPFLSGHELLLALYHTATDQGEPGEDNTFGMGLINVMAAFNYLSTMYDPAPPVSTEVDVELLSIDSPSQELRCSLGEFAMVSPEVTVVNNGNSAIESLQFLYTINGGDEISFEATDLGLAQGQSTQVTLAPIASTGTGFTELHVRIAPLAGEGDTFNNHAVRRWIQSYTHPPGSEFFAEEFNDGLEVWTVLNPDHDITWDSLWVIQKDGTMGYAAWLNHPDYITIGGQEDLLISPSLSPASSEHSVTFDYFYRKRSNTLVQQDTLVVSAIYNCGSDAVELWRKGGSELWTVDINQANALPSSGDQWAAVSISFNNDMLPDFSPEGGLKIAFTSVNRRGNNMLIDNVMVDQAGNVAQLVKRPSLQLSPNPARNEVRLDWNLNTPANEVRIYDMRGKVVLRRGQVAQAGILPLAGLSLGMYLVEVQFSSGERAMEKLVVY